MSKDREGVEYVDWQERGAAPSSGRRVQEITAWWTPWRLCAVLGAGVFAAFVLISGLIGVPGDTWGSRQAQDAPVPDGGLLADVGGEDRLYRLEFTHAALGREMELLREWLSGHYEGELPPASAAVLAQSVAQLEAGHGMLDGHVAALEARLRALHEEINRLETALETMGSLSGDLHLLEEGN